MSLTTAPLVPGITPLKFTPKSLRLISPLAEKPARVPPKGSGPKPLSSSLRVTGRVTSLMVRLPSSRKSPPSGRTPVDTNVMVGCFSTCRKSSLRTWLSRSLWLVVIEDASMVAFTADCSGSAPVVKVPSTFSNLPRTLLTIMCRTLNPTSE